MIKLRTLLGAPNPLGVGTQTEGQSMVEYAFILALVVITCIVAMTILGDVVQNNLWGLITSTFPSF